MEFSQVLCSPLWQGIAGISQIFAAILCGITIKQAWDIQKKAVAPDLRIHCISRHYESTNFLEYNITLANVGFGSALKVKAACTSRNLHIKVGDHLCLPNNQVTITWLESVELIPYDESSRIIIKVEANTRFYQRFEWEINFPYHFKAQFGLTDLGKIVPGNKITKKIIGSRR